MTRFYLDLQFDILAKEKRKQNEQKIYDDAYSFDDIDVDVKMSDVDDADDLETSNYDDQVSAYKNFATKYDEKKIDDKNDLDVDTSVDDYNQIINLDYHTHTKSGLAKKEENDQKLIKMKLESENDRKSLEKLMHEIDEINKHAMEAKKETERKLRNEIRLAVERELEENENKSRKEL